VVTGKEPIKKSRACSTDVKKAGRAWRKAGDNRLHEFWNSFSHQLVICSTKNLTHTIVGGRTQERGSVLELRYKEMRAAWLGSKK
jgi:hypothetical protein